MEALVMGAPTLRAAFSLVFSVSLLHQVENKKVQL